MYIVDAPIKKPGETQDFTPYKQHNSFLSLDDNKLWFVLMKRSHSKHEACMQSSYLYCITYSGENKYISLGRKSRWVLLLICSYHNLPFHLNEGKLWFIHTQLAIKKFPELGWNCALESPSDCKLWFVHTTVYPAGGGRGWETTVCLLQTGRSFWFPTWM